LYNGYNAIIENEIILKSQRIILKIKTMNGAIRNE
jgi:hypothetical protein